MEKENIDILVQSIGRQLHSLYGDRADMSAKASEAVMMLLDHNPAYDLSAYTAQPTLFHDVIPPGDLQETLATLNEKELRRRTDGVYYTLPDVTGFITTNAYIKFIHHTSSGIVPADKLSECLDALTEQERGRLTRASVFDPTCGAGEFLITALAHKLRLAGEECGDEQILDIAGTIYGNDIATDSVHIAKIRLFFTLLPRINDPDLFERLAGILNTNFTTREYINADTTAFGTYDIIIGNPPYIEYRMLDFEPRERLGNTYANVLSNASRMLSPDGVMGFIIPISFVATPRMSPIRNIIDGTFENICLLNYADRPDCLFTGVHQKLTILLASKISDAKGYFSSSYNYWYKQERGGLFDRDSQTEVSPNLSLYIPKLGNRTEREIFDKCVVGMYDRSLIDHCSKSSATEGDTDVYLNMRNCFWIKAFSFNPGSSEYKRLICRKEDAGFIRCLLNSSLFFFFWIAVSDCWHITSKELGLIRLPNLKGDQAIYTELFRRLEERLEETKVYVGTRQTEYEYKHRYCKDIIDEIDDAIAPCYNLTPTECEYIKSFILKYRLSDGAKS